MRDITIYIACSGPDGRQAAEAIKDHAARRSDAISVSFAAETSGPAEIWRQRLDAAVRDSDVLLVLISPDMRGPPDRIARAIAAAEAADIPIIPVRLGGAGIPLAEWPPRLSSLHHAVLDGTSERQLEDILVAARALVLEARRHPEAARAPGSSPGRSATAEIPPFTIADLARMRTGANVRSTALPPEITSLLRSAPDDVDPVIDAEPAPVPPVPRSAAGWPPMPAPAPASPPAMAAPPPRPTPAAPQRRRSTLLMSGTAALALGVFAVGVVRYQFGDWGTASAPPSLSPPMPSQPPPPPSDFRGPEIRSSSIGRAASPENPTRFNWLSPRNVLHGGLGALPLLPLLAMTGGPAIEPPMPPQKMDVVDVSAFAPSEAEPQSQVLVQVYLHKLRQLADVKEHAVRKDPDTAWRETATLATEIPRGQRLGIELSCDGLSIREPLQHVDWTGRPAAVGFTVSVAEQAAGRKFVLSVRVLADEIPIGRLDFALRVTRPAEAADPTPAIQGLSAKRYRYAFFSYSSADRAEVLKNARLLRALNIGFFQDLLSLEAGQRFEPALFAEIDRCDLFLLFWSKSAAQSDWVIRETEHALSRQGIGQNVDPDIKPIILEGPPVPRPPASLGHLHFNDFITHIIAAIESSPRA